LDRSNNNNDDDDNFSFLLLLGCRFGQLLLDRRPVTEQVAELFFELESIL
jgi:hypothetical protein